MQKAIKNYKVIQMGLEDTEAAEIFCKVFCKVQKAPNLRFKLL